METYLTGYPWNTEDPAATMREAEKLALEYQDLYRQYTLKIFEFTDIETPATPYTIENPQAWADYLAKSKVAEHQSHALRKEIRSLQYEQVIRLQALLTTIPARHLSRLLRSWIGWDSRMKH